MMKKLAVYLLLTGVFASTLIPAGYAWLTPGFWKNHPDAWPVDSLLLGSGTVTKAEAIGILKTPPKGGDATLILAHALIAFKLNVIVGGGYGGAYDGLIAEGDGYLAAHGIGTDYRGPDRADMIDLAQLLDDYNNDLI